MRRFSCLLGLFLIPALPVWADELPLRPSARLLIAEPAAFAPGNCLIYRESGSGLILVDPTYYLRGEVVVAEVRTQHLGHCPQFAGKHDLARYSRDEFIAHARAYPCVSPQVPERDERIGMVRLRVLDWETPYERRMANAGRLYRGQLLAQKLEKGIEIELEADALAECSP